MKPLKNPEETVKKPFKNPEETHVNVWTTNM
jgi:hypothetical protein